MVTRIQPAVSDPETARSVVGLLRQLPDSEPVPPASDSTQLLDALARLAEGTVADLPEVVLVHEHIRPMPALDLIREIALRFPAVGVVLITRDTSQPLYSAAMDAGARGVLGLPLSYEDVAARVDAAASWAVGVRRHLGSVPEGPEGPGGTVVAVTGAKGGVGTTLTAVHIALAAQASGRGTALVDMDLQSGDVASYLDVQFRRSVADLAGIDDVSVRVLQDAVFAHESGLGLLLAPGEGERGEEIDDRAARQIVTSLRARYDVVVIDCGTQLNAANAAAIETSDSAVLLTTPDVVSVRAAKRMVRMWDRLQIRKAEEALTLVNRTSRYTEIQPPLIARIVGTAVAGTTIPANYKELQSALDAGRIQDLDAKSSVRQALWSFADELGIVTGPEAAAAGGKNGKSGGKGTGKGTGTAKAAKGSSAAPQQVLPPTVPGAGGRQALPPGGSAGTQGKHAQHAQGQPPQSTGAQPGQSQPGPTQPGQVPGAHPGAQVPPAQGQSAPGQSGQGQAQPPRQSAQPQRASQGIYGP
ncbi:AAA family ATPase, partial [Streptomyces nanshensis]|uniref:AAA family ATPase n=1 Tax=Streptomyces nanshensis TaxID=518642 RepID=UPI000ACA7146